MIKNTVHCKKSDLIPAVVSIDFWTNVISFYIKKKKNKQKALVGIFLH